jgi:hypothetical protein
MNRKASKHLDKAVEYVAKGDEFYAKAADEILAAQKADSTLSNREIGERFDHSEAWVRELVRWRTSSTTSRTPYSETGRPHQDLVATKKVLGDPITRRKALAGLPASDAAEVMETLGSRDDVIDHLADDVDAAERVLHQPTNRVFDRSDEKRGIDRSQRVKRPTDTPWDVHVAKAEIVLHIVKAVQIAKDNSLVEFAVGHFTDAMETLEMALAADDPKAAVDDFIARLQEEEEGMTA